MTALLKSVLAAAAAAALTSSLAVAQPAPPDGPPPAGGQDAPPPPPAPAEPQTLKGTVLGYNYGPAGDANGLVLTGDDGKPVQVNFPPAFATAVKAAATPGQAVTVTGRPLPPPPGRGPDAEAPKPDHTVLELDTVAGPDGKPVTMPAPGEHKTVHVDGKVKYLNYSRDGRAVGAVLDDGTFVVTGPGAAAELKLAAGQTLAVDGQDRPAPGPYKIVVATSVNGKAVQPPRRPRPTGGPGSGPGGPGGNGGNGGGPGGHDGGPGGQGGNDGPAAATGELSTVSPVAWASCPRHEVAALPICRSAVVWASCPRGGQARHSRSEINPAALAASARVERVACGDGWIRPGTADERGYAFPWAKCPQYEQVALPFRRSAVV